MDIKFIRDDTEEKAVKELTEILDVLSSRRTSSEVYAAKKFLLKLIAVSKPKIEEPKPELTLVTAPEKPSVPDQKADVSTVALEQNTQVNQEQTTAEIIPTPEAKIEQETPSMIPPLLKNRVYHPPEVQETIRPIPEARFEAKQESKQEEIKQEEVKQEKVLPKLEPRKPRKIISSEVGSPLVFVKDRHGGALVLSSVARAETGLIYRVVEPIVDIKALSMAKVLIGRDVRKNPGYLEDEKFMKKNIEKAMKKVRLTYSENYAEKLRYFLKRDLLGFGKVDVLMHDSRISSVICDGVDKPMRISLGNKEVITNVVFSNPEELNSFVKYIASKGKEYVPSTGPSFALVFENWKIEGTVGFGGISSRFIMRKS